MPTGWLRPSVAAGCPHLGLQVDLGIPVGVVEHHGVCGGQVDSETPRTRGQHEDKLVTARAVVVVDVVLGGGGGGGNRDTSIN